jgi:four helix bundle protein
MDLAEQIYRIIAKFLKEEMYALTNQIRRAAVSIPSNIAEGQARKSTAEFRNFLSIAQGSRAELETQILLAQRLNYITQEEATQLCNQTEEISKMLYVLMNRLN